MKYRNNCPACNSSTSTITGSKGKKNTNKIGSVEITQEEYYIYKCSNCGLYFRSPILDDEELQLHYSTYDYEVLHNSTALFPTERLVYKFLKRQHRGDLKKTILDYGCNEGNFLSLFVNDFNCYGYEIDDRVKKKAEEKGIVMLNASDLESIGKKFDYILLIDVFEHLKNPTETISYLLNRLSKSGKLIISTGYADSQCCRNDLANYWYFSDCIQHLCMIGSDYIEYLKKEFNLDVIYQKSTSHYDFKVGKIQGVTHFIKYQAYLLSRHINKIKLFKSILGYIPLLRKPLAWNSPPYYPKLHEPALLEDHCVLVLQRKF